MGSIEPAWKSIAIDDALTKLTGRSRVATILAHKCVTCDYDATYFRDELSRREYSISGMCQRCQDKVFGTEQEEPDFL